MAFAYAVGGKRPAIYAAIFFSLVALSGWWDRSVITAALLRSYLY